ncbi:MAG: FixH family protein [Pseudolabrys sp.]
MTQTPARKPREVTGRMVLYCLLGFFGAVIAVNVVMVKAAMSTFGGVETSSSYKAGLLFKNEVAAAERQDAQHWRVDGKLNRDRAGEAVLALAVHDANDAPVAGLAAKALLAHPADSRLDHAITLDRIGAGEFRGQTAAQAGQWELIVDLYRGDARVYRSRNRVTLK